MNRAASLKKQKQQTKENKPSGEKSATKAKIRDSGPIDLDFIPDKDIGRGLPPRVDNRSQSKLDSKDSSEVKERTYSYLRSKRQVQTLLKDKFDMGAAQLETDNLNLVKRLNGHLLELDKLNEEKRRMSQNLIDQIRFVRDLQSQLGTADNGHVTEVIDKELEGHFRREKQLNVQLREKLKECEIEKCQIAEQVKFMEGQRDVTVVQQTGNDTDLDRQMMNVDQMLQYRAQIAKNLDDVIRDIEALRVDEDSVARTIHHLRTQIDKVAAERNKAAHDIQMMQVRLQDGQSLINRDSNDLKYELNKQKSMLGLKVIEKAIEKILKKKKVDYFTHLVRQIEVDDQQIGSVLAFRSMCLRYRERRQRKYFDLWFSRGLRPMSLIRQNRDVTQYQQKDFDIQKFFRLWRLQQLKSQKTGSHQLQTLERCLFCFRNFEKRKLKHALSQWHRNTNNIMLAKSKLARFIIEKMLIKVRRAVRRWQRLVTFEDYQMRLQSQCTRAAHLQYKSQLFHGWRQVTVQFKVVRTVKLIRCWNQLDKFRMIKRCKNRKVHLALMYNQLYKQLLAAACWGQMKYELRKERYLGTLEILRTEVDPDIERLGGEIRAIVYQSERKKRQRVMHMILLWTVGKIYKCFHKWKKYTQIARRVILENTKRRILNLHRIRQMDALTKWAHVIAFNKKMMKKAITDQIYQERTIMEDELQVTRLAIENSQLKSYNRGRRLAGQIINRLAMNRVQYRFRMWHQNLRDKDLRLDKLDFIAVTKRNRRIVKRYFKRYVEQVKKKRVDDNTGPRGDYYEEMLRYRAMKRMFKAMRKFQTEHHIAKANLRKRLKVMDLNTKKSFFLCWLQECKVQNHQEQVETQSTRVKRLQKSVVRSGNLQSKIHEQQTSIKEQKTQMTDLARKTLGKTINRFQLYRAYTGFITWRERVEEQKHYRQRIQYQLIKRLQFSKETKAFNKWRDAAKKKKMRKHVVQMEAVQQGQLQEETLIEEGRQEHAKVLEVRSENLRSIKEKQEKHRKKRNNIVERKAHNKMNYYSINRLEHFFSTWRKFARQRRQRRIRLVKLLQKNHYQFGFDEIKAAARVHKQKERNERRIVRMAALLMAQHRQFYFHTWKASLRLMVNEKTAQVETTLYHLTKNNEYKRQSKTSNIVDSHVHVLRQNMKKNCFIALYDNRCKRIDQKINHKDMVDKLKSMRARKAVQIWKARAKLTIVSRQRGEQVRMLTRAYYLRRCFNAMKKNYHATCKGMHKLQQILTLTRAFQKKYAMKQIKQMAAVRKQDRKYGKLSARNVLASMLTRRERTQLLRGFDRFRSDLECKNDRVRTMKSILGKRLNTHYRSYFDAWRRNAEKGTAVDEATEYGGQRQELLKQKSRVKVLKEKLREEGYTGEEIDKIIADDNLHYKQQVERALCRLFTFGEGVQGHSKLHLLPWCIDKWRRYVKERKAFKYWLGYLESRTDPDRNNIRWAFERWAVMVQGHKGELKTWKYPWLQTYDYHNRKLAKEQKELTETKQALINDLRGQRQFLIQRVVSSQRLALAYCHDSHTLAKMTTWRQFVRNTRVATRTWHVRKTRENLEAIEDMKLRMEYLQKKNEEVARENDELRDGTLACVKTIKTAQQLQKQVEELSIALAEKAVTIRKLLEANAKMSKEIEQLKK